MKETKENAKIIHLIFLLLLAIMFGCGGGSENKDSDAEEITDLIPDDGFQGIDNEIPSEESMEFDWLDGQCSGEWITMMLTFTSMIYLVDRSTLMLDPIDNHEPDPSEMGSCQTLNYAPATGITYTTWWDSVSSTLKDFASSNTQYKIAQGLVLYPGPGRIGEPTGVDAIRMCDGPVTRPVTLVAPEIESGSSISSALEDPDSVPVCEGGFAPLKKGLEVAGNSLDRVQPGPHTILVIARSGPNCNLSMPICEEQDCTVDINYCNGVRGTVGCQDALSVIDTITDLHQNKGIDVYVVGLPGSERFSSYFDSMAEAGGTALSQSPKYRAVTDPASLGAVLSEIAEKEIGCYFALQSTPSDSVNINVLVDGEPLKKDDPNGYSYDSVNGIVELLGQSCADFIEGKIQEVKFLAGCPPYNG